MRRRLPDELRAFADLLAEAAQELEDLEATVTELQHEIDEMKETR